MLRAVRTCARCAREIAQKTSERCQRNEKQMIVKGGRRRRPSGWSAVSHLSHRRSLSDAQGRDWLPGAGLWVNRHLMDHRVEAQRAGVCL